MTGRTIANMHAALSWDLDDFDRGTSHIEAGFTKLRTLVLGIGDAFVAQGKRMTLGVTLPSAAFALFTTKAASDAKELESAFDHSFGVISNRMDKWAEDTGDSLDRATTEMKDGALAFNQIFGKATTKEAAAELSQEFTELSQNAASFFNTDFDTALGKLRSGLSGESEPLRDFGVFINEAAVENQALKMGLIETGQELNEFGKIMARAALISEGMAQANGDIERTGGELANMWRGLMADLRELSEYMGEKFLPYAKAVVAWARSAVQWFKNLPEPVHKFIIVMGVAAAAMGPLILAMTTLAIVLLPLLVFRSGTLLLALSALLNPIGTAVVLLAKFVVRMGFSITMLKSFAGMLLRTLGPLGLLITAIILFKDYIVEGFSEVWRTAEKYLGPPLQELMLSLSKIADQVRKAFNVIAESDLGWFISQIIPLIGELISLLLQAAGFVVIYGLRGIIEVFNAIAENALGLVTMVRRLFEGDWAGAWDAAASVVGNALTRIAGWIEGIFPKLSALLKMMGQVIGTADFLNDDSPLGSAVGGAVGQFWDVLGKSQAKSDDAVDLSGGNYAEAGSGKKAKSGGRGRAGPTKEELAARREELRLTQLLAVAREKGDVEQERALQRQIDKRDLIERYMRAGLAKQAAMAAAEKDLAEMDQARAETRAKVLDDHERSIDLQLAELRNDYELANLLQDEEFIEKRILFYREQGLDIAKAEKLAANDLNDQERERGNLISRRLADQERERQIELARIRGDDPAQIRAMEDSLRIGDRADELRENGLNDADAFAQATQEGMDRSKAHLQGTFRDTFRNGLRAAMDGNLGSFIEGFWKDKLFNVFANILDRFADNLANLVTGQGSGGGLFGSLLGLAGSASGLGFLGGNTASAMGAQSLASLQSTFTPGFDSGGSFKVKGFAGIDRNLLSLNGSPIARVGNGEIMDIRKGEGSGGQAKVMIQPSPYFNAVVDGRAAAVAGPMAQAAAGAGVSLSRVDRFNQADRQFP